MAEKKMTKKEKFELILAQVAGDEMLTEFIKHEIELLSSKRSKGNAKKNMEHEAFMDLIRDVLSEAQAPMQCNAIAKDARLQAFEWRDGSSTSSQRVSAMLRKMVESGDVIKSFEKKVSYFTLA